MVCNVPAHAHCKNRVVALTHIGLPQLQPQHQRMIKEPTRSVFFGGDSNMQVAHCKNKTLVLTQLGLSQLQLPILNHA